MRLEFFEQKIIFQSPNIVSTLGDSIIDFILLKIGKKENILLVKIGFEVENTSVKGDFMLVFTMSSLSPLLKKLKQKVSI